AAGDAPVGYRLPLASLRQLGATSYPHVVPADPLAPRPPLPDPDAILAPPEAPKTPGPGHGVDPRAQRRAAFRADTTEQQPLHEQVLDEITADVRTAITVEARDGRLCV